jgi:hypothetical protein
MRPLSFFGRSASYLPLDDGTSLTMSDEKVGQDMFVDHDATISHEEAMHHGALTEEELAVEKKLVRKIDLLIMPLVVLVYLMNYIDR